MNTRECYHGEAYPEPKNVEDFLDLGEIVTYCRDCGCDNCVETLGGIVEELGSRVTEIGFRMNQMTKRGENLPLLLRGQVEDWTIQQFRDAMIQQREEAECH